MASATQLYRMDNRPLRILAIAEAANPDWVSVPLVGWSLASALRAVADVKIVTQVRNRSSFLARGLVEGQDFVCIDTEDLAAPAYRLASLLRGGEQKGWTTLTAIQSLTYPVFERRVWRQFGAAIQGGAFDLVHRITPLSPTSPSFLAKRCALANVPFVLGPLNGGLPWPPGFERERVREREWLSYFRAFYSRLSPIRETCHHSRAVIAGSLHTASELRPYTPGRIVYVPENGVWENQIRDDKKGSSDTLRLCFVGRLVPYKNADVVLRAAQALLSSHKATLAIVGDGPERTRLSKICFELGITDRVTFHGWTSHDSVATILVNSDLLVFPSIREFGGGVVLEAMAAGVIPIVPAYGGPGELVDRDCGFAIPLSTKEQLITSYATLLNEIGAGKYDIASMSRAAAQRIRRLYTWEKKAAQMVDIYRWVLAGEREVLDFGFLGAAPRAGCPSERRYHAS